MVENHKKGLPTAILTMDQSSAYDICDHQVILDKMELLGLDTNTIAWMKSYLGDRTQVVEIQTKISPEIKMPPCSVIPYSIRSCLIYSILTTNLPWAIHNQHQHNTEQDYDCEAGTVSLYVNDTSAVVSGPTTQQLVIKIQATSESIEKYLDDNLSKVNTECY